MDISRHGLRSEKLDIVNLKNRVICRTKFGKLAPVYFADRVPRFGGLSRSKTDRPWTRRVGAQSALHWSSLRRRAPPARRSRGPSWPSENPAARRWEAVQFSPKKAGLAQ